MRHTLRFAALAAHSWLLIGCGLALGLDEYDISSQLGGASGDGDSGSTVGGDGDGDGDSSGGYASGSGGRTTSSSGGSDQQGSGGRSEPASGGSSGGNGSGGVTTSGGTSSGGDSASGGRVPDCMDDSEDAEPDTGCSSALPFCVNESCVECQKEEDCGDDGQSCSNETCNSGTCERNYDSSGCPHFGDPCYQVACTSNGCEEADISVTFDLLDGSGDFESANGWELDGDAEIRTQPVGTGSPHGGTQIALMTWGANEVGNVYRNLQVPTYTESLTITGYYRSFGQGTDHADDFFRVGFWGVTEDAEEDWLFLALNTEGDAALSEVPAWSYFSQTVAYDDLVHSADNTVEFDLLGATDSAQGNRNFAADDVLVMARVCAP